MMAKVFSPLSYIYNFADPANQIYSRVYSFYDILNLYLELCVTLLPLAVSKYDLSVEIAW
jgi:hypothetical protein